MYNVHKCVACAVLCCAVRALTCYKRVRCAVCCFVLCAMLIYQGSAKHAYSAALKRIRTSTIYSVLQYTKALDIVALDIVCASAQYTQDIGLAHYGALFALYDMQSMVRYAHTVYGLRLTAYGLRFTVYGLRLTVYGLRFTVYGVRLTAYGLRCTAYGLRFTVYGLRCTVYGLRLTVYG